MGKLEMRTSDLGELYILLKMYRDTYGIEAEEFMKDIARRYMGSKGLGDERSNTEDRISITNPRGAKRRSDIKQAEKERILQLRRAGRTMREIMSETGRSLGYVHKLIREHEAMCCTVTKNEKGHS